MKTSCVHLKFIQFLFVNYTSVKLEKEIKIRSGHSPFQKHYPLLPTLPPQSFLYPSEYPVPHNELKGSIRCGAAVCLTLLLFPTSLQPHVSLVFLELAKPNSFTGSLLLSTDYLEFSPSHRHTTHFLTSFAL